MKAFRRVFVTMLLGVAVVAGTGYFIMHYQAEAQRPANPFRARRAAIQTVPVLAATAKTADVPVYLDGVGTTKALNTVTVRPQVDGKLISINFKEGQDVAKGDVLAKIDPTTYQAQLGQAVAKKAQDEAQLANAKQDYKRYARLAETHAGSQQQADTQKATVAQLQAQVEVDQAVIDNARALVGYTTITAPISGRTGIRLVDEGNLVRAADATGIVVITQIKPISVLFSLPQQQIREINAAFAQAPLPVDAIGSDNKSVIESGKLTVVDNQVDQTHRDGEAQGRILQCRAAALAGPVRQRPAAAEDAEERGRGPDRSGAARAGRNLRLRHQTGRQRDGAAGDPDSAGRRPVGARERLAGRPARRHHRLCPARRGQARERLRRQHGAARRSAEAPAPPPERAAAGIAAQS